MGNYLPSSKNTIARVEYYRSNRHIRAEDLGKIVYKEGKVLLQKDIHYDRKTGYINFTAYTKTDYDEFMKKQETDCIKEIDITAVEKSENISSKKTEDKKIQKKIQKKNVVSKPLLLLKVIKFNKLKILNLIFGCEYLKSRTICKSLSTTIS